jgi:hypothetical protein
MRGLPITFLAGITVVRMIATTNTVSQAKSEVIYLQTQCIFT